MKNANSAGSLWLLFSFAERGSHRRSRLADEESLVLSILPHASVGDELRLQQALVLVTPDHQVKEVRDERRRNVVGGAMLCSNRWEKKTSEDQIINSAAENRLSLFE